jgi:hypothetical protein
VGNSFTSVRPSLGVSDPLPGGGVAPRTPPGKREARAVAVAGIAFAVVAAVLIVGLVLETPSGGTPAAGGTGGAGAVRITSVEWDFAGFPCDGESTFSLAAGAAVAPGTVLNESRQVVNNATLGTCTFSHPLVTAGFTVLGSNTPLTIGGEGNGTLSVTIESPDHAWSGQLVIDLTIATAF